MAVLFRTGSTTTIDRIAASGTRFEHFFVASPVCSPSRANFLTGRISSQHGVHDWIRGGNVGEDADTPWVINPRQDRLARMPWSDDFKAELNRAFEDQETYYTGEDLDRWLDSMSYKDLLEQVMGFSPQVTEYFDPIIAISMGGVGADVYSAYSARQLELPGTQAHYQYDSSQDDDDVGAYSFPGGNTGIFRHIVKYLMPDSITGDNSFESNLNNPIDFSALDRPANPLNIRLNATAIDVSHAGPAESSDHVNVSYYKDGKISRRKPRLLLCRSGDGWHAISSAICHHRSKRLTVTFTTRRFLL
ncbi:MAG: sulfatase-like hydrolase/transferase [Proteobacteria bacterium]|nr:sulfatase-like hydrolase/transferase [Pseudomonadota bacterium]